MYKGLKTYIAGPVTGANGYKERFEQAAEHLRGLGAIPMYSTGLPLGFDHGEYLYICFAMIDVCDAVYFLDNWWNSPGAMKEFQYARTKNKQLLYEDLDPAWKFDNAVEVSG